MSTYNVKMNQTEHYRKYNSIVRMGHRDSHGVLQEGDMIAVYEKLDGSNASFKLVGDVIMAFSRNLPLDEDNNLNGFFQWTQTLPKEELTEGSTYYGEWLVPHKVDYGENARQFYLFDIWEKHYLDTEYRYGDFVDVAIEAHSIGLQMAPLFYVGKYKGYEHLKTFVGRSALAVDPAKGEGIVVKNYGYRSKHDTQVFLKMVSESFAEVQKVKPPRDPKLDNEATQLAREFTTEARVEKAVDRLIEKGDITERTLELSNMGVLIMLVGNEVAADVISEEAPHDADDQYRKDVKKTMGKLVPPLLRKIIEVRSMEAIE